MAEAAPAASRRDLLRFRFRRHQLDRRPGTSRSKQPDLLDYGIQDTGHDGAGWALAVRGAPPGHAGLALAWTLRGAPHAYRTADLAGVAVATAPYEKGDLSSELTARLDDPYLRECRPCAATHAYENSFRLAALQAGLTLEWGTSPPVLRRVPRLRAPAFGTLAGDAAPRFEVIRNHLRFYPGARVRDVAAFLDAPIKVVRAHWPDDAVEVVVRDDPTPGKAEPRFVLADDVDATTDVDEMTEVRLLGPYDPYLQLRDRELLVGDAAHRKDVWRVLGRPGGIVRDGEVVGTWRPRSSAKGLTIHVDPWRKWTKAERAAVDEQAERLAAFRDVDLLDVADAS